MKKHLSISLTLLACAVLLTTLSSFKNKGGDVFEIYFNGKQLHKQFIPNDKSVKTLQLADISGTDKIDVLYSHCGVTGKSRVLTLRNEKNEVVKEFRFADAGSNRSLMSFFWKDVTGTKNKTSKLNLYYSAKELPEGKLLAAFNWKASNRAAHL